MKLQGQAAAGFCAKPDKHLVGALLFGPDASLIQLRRTELIGALTEGDDLRLDRLEAADVRRDPASLDTALKSQGFFPGRRAVVVSGATDGLSKLLAEILGGVTQEDAFLIATADQLPARSSLRKLFESRGNLACLAFYADPPDERDIVELLRAKDITSGIEEDALALLTGIARDLDRGQLVQFIEKISLYHFNSESKINSDVIAHLAPQTTEAAVDQLVDAIANGHVNEIGPLVGRMSSAGVNAVQMLLMTSRRFRQMLHLASAKDGIDAALRRLRPPAFGLRAQTLSRQARSWGQDRIELALALLYKADRTLRSPGQRPDMALVERTLIRVAMLAGRR